MKHEPTEAMISAGHKYILDEQLKNKPPDIREFCAELYRIMEQAREKDSDDNNKHDRA